MWRRTGRAARATVWGGSASAGGWAFAIEHGHCETLSRIEDVSHDGGEAFYYAHNPFHPPTIVFYAYDGRGVSGFGCGRS